MERKNKDTKPLYYKNSDEMDKPISELIQELRSDLSEIRGKLNDIKNSYGWHDWVEPIQGGLTCMLVTMYDTMQEIKKFEELKNNK